MKLGCCLACLLLIASRISRFVMAWSRFEARKAVKPSPPRSFGGIRRKAMALFPGPHASRIFHCPVRLCRFPCSQWLRQLVKRDGHELKLPSFTAHQAEQTDAWQSEFATDIRDEVSALGISLFGR